MINLLIEPNDEFVVEFAVAKDKNGRIYSDTNLVDLKEMLSTVGIECEIEEHSAIFKKPNFHFGSCIGFGIGFNIFSTFS